MDAYTLPDTLSATAMVISHGCEIDKPASKTCYVAQVLPLSTIPPSGHAAVRQGNVAAVMHLPQHEALGGEAYVDLRMIFRVPLEQIRSAELRQEQSGEKVRLLANPAKRLAGLSAYGLSVLHGQLIVFFTRSKMSGA